MNKGLNVLGKLIAAAYRGPVFGKNQAFGHDAEQSQTIVRSQVAAIAVLFAGKMQATLKTAMPQADKVTLQKIMHQIGPKSISFCPALTAGELPDPASTERLAAAARAIGVMYFADQTMDRGDEQMAVAIEQLCGDNPSIPAADAEKVAAYATALQDIAGNIDDFALEADRPFVLECYTDQVLLGEVRLLRLSQQYLAVDADRQKTFLDKHAATIADNMVDDAGFPSVTASLYAIYRHNEPGLLSLERVHSDPTILKLLQMCNAVARIIDELGDWEIDVGRHPDWGIFAINPFNQYHPQLVARLCELAQIDASDQVADLQQAFRGFHSDHKGTAQVVTQLLFDHARQYFDELPPAVLATHDRYITLCKRVLEISHVNVIGDRSLAA